MLGLSAACTLSFPPALISASLNNKPRSLGVPKSVSKLSTPQQLGLAGMKTGSSPHISTTAAHLRRKDHSMDGITSRHAYVRASASEAAESGGVSYNNSSPASLLPVLTAVAFAGCGAFSFGYHLGVVNGPLEAIALDLGFAGNTALQGAIVSSSLAGAALGSLGGAGLADNVGRRKAFLIDAVPLLAGALLCASATGLSTMLLGRALVGIGIGLSSALVPLYISEIAPTKLRGTLGSINQLLICVGILAALVVNVGIPAQAWRSMFVISAVPAVLLALGMLSVCPESPTWLALTGQRTLAETTAVKLWGPDGVSQLGSDKSDGGARSEPSWGEVLSSRGAQIGVILFILQQFSGINAIVYFSSSVFAKAGVTSGALASAAVGVVNVLGTIVAGGLMDKAGRKQLLTISFAGMGLAMLTMALGLALPGLATYSGPIALVGTLAYILAFAFGAGPVPGLLVPEITAAKVRGRAVALAMGSHWVCNFFIGQMFLAAVNAMGVATCYTFFAVVCAAAVLFVNTSVVETKGRSLEDIERAMAAV